MRSGLAVLFPLALLAACTTDAGSGAKRSETRAAQIAPPHVFERTAHQWDGGFGKGLKVRYETALSITDIPALRHEADSLWSTLRDSAEREHVCTVELEASEPAHTVSVPGTQMQGSARRNFSFLLRHDSAGGWRWLTSTDQPLRPCVG